MYGYNIIFSKKLGIRHLIGYSLNYPIKYFSFGRSLSGRAIQGFRPHRSSTLQVRPSLAMLQSGADMLAFSSLFFRVAGSSLTCNVTERGGHAAFPSPSFRVAGSSLTCNVTERFGQRRSTLAFFHVAGSFLACNVTERFGKRRSTLASFHVAGSFLACNVTERLRTALLPYYP